MRQDTDMVILASAVESVRRRWRKGLGQVPQIYEAAHQQALEDLLRAHNHAITLLHLTLPGLEPTRGIATLREGYRDVKLVVFSDRPDEQEGRQLLTSGISGYCNTHIAPALLAKAVSVVQSGEVWIGRKLIRYLVEDLAKTNGRRQTAPAELKLDALTTREREIAQLVGDGAGNKRIAQELEITERTVKAHVSSIFRKTGARDRLKLALLVNGQYA